MKTMTIDLPDFRNMTTGEAIAFFRTQKDESFGPLIRWIAEAEAYRRSNREVRVAIANGERFAEAVVADTVDA